MLINKKGAVAETITWLVATLVIIILIAVFLYASWGISGVYNNLNIVDYRKGGDYLKSDLLLIKTETGFLMTPINRKKVSEMSSTDFNNAKNVIENILMKLPVLVPQSSGWNIKINYPDGTEKIYSYWVFDFADYGEKDFILPGNIKATIWQDCQGDVQCNANK